MELRNVKTFIKVAELGNFSKASAELGYAQSTVTTQIQALEKELKVTLFERAGKRATLSAAGREFLEYAYNFAMIENLALDHFSADSEPTGELRVGVMETICASVYGMIFKRFKAKYPKVNLKIVVAKTLDCMEMLEKGSLDVILTLDRKINHDNWKCEHEMPAEISFFCSSNHRFAERKDVILEELLTEDFIQIEEGCNYRDAFERYVLDRGKDISNMMEIGYTRLIIDAVANNLGVSLLPMFTLTEALERGRISTFSLRNFNINMSVQVIHAENRWMTPALRGFVDIAKEIFV